MWILSFMYEDEVGKHHAFCKVLQRKNDYSIGRSVNCDFRIENDKSVSRVHLSMNFQQKDLLITNKGKLTKYNDNPVPLGDTIAIHNQDSLFQIGGSPIDVRIRYIYQEWKIPHALNESIDLKTIEQYGITLLDSFSKRCTLQIVSNKKEHGSCLFAILKGIPVVSTEFLENVSRLLTSENYAAFESTFKGLLYRYNIFPRYSFIPNPLTGISFIVFDKILYNMLKYTIEVGGGELLLYMDAEELDTFLSSTSSQRIVGLTSNSYNLMKSIASSNLELDSALNDVLLRHGISSQTINELVMSILNNKVNDLMKSKLNSAVAQRQVSDLSSQPPKTRTNNTIFEKTDDLDIKPNTEPLQSLNYLGGGDTFSVPPSPVREKEPLDHAKKEPFPNLNPVSECITNTKESVADIKSDRNNSTSEFNVQSKPRRKRPLVKPLANLMMRNDSVTVETSSEDSRPKRLKIEKPEMISDKIDILPKTSSVPQLPASGVNANMGAKLDLFKTLDLSDQSSENQDKKTDESFQIQSSEEEVAIKQPKNNSNSIASAIVETKKQEVKRIKEGIFEIDAAELTEDAITDLKDVAVVSKAALKQRHIEPNIESTKDLAWSGRKNFKSFKKVWPVYLKNSKVTDETSCNKTSLSIGRKYVSMVNYDPSEASQYISMNEKAPTSSDESPTVASSDKSTYRQENKIPNFEFTARESYVATGGLFVEDDDDESQMTESKIHDIVPLNSHKNNSRSASLVVTGEDEDESADDEPKFNFRSRNIR